MTCVVCGERIGPGDRDPWQEKRGFEEPVSQRRDGTGSSLYGRVPTGAWACHDCGFKIKHGNDPRQARLQL